MTTINQTIVSVHGLSECAVTQALVIDQAASCSDVAPRNVCLFTLRRAWLPRRLTTGTKAMAAFTLPERIALPRVQESEEVERREDQGASSKGKPAGVRCQSVELRGAIAVYSWDSAGLPWTEAEHLQFLQGLRVFGKGKWRQISRVFLSKKKTPTQVRLIACATVCRPFKDDGGR